MRAASLPAMLLTLATLACSGEAATGSAAPSAAPTLSIVSSARPTSSARWNLLAQQVVARREMGPLGIARTMSMVSVAQYDAVVAAGASTGVRKPDQGAAAAAASAAVLVGIYPVEAPVIAAELAADRAAFGTRADARTDFTAGEAVGNGIAAAVLTRGATDGSAAIWTGTVPTGPGFWFSAPAPARPLSPLWGQVRPWLMSSGSQFRPAAPPAFGSAAFTDALAEVRHFSDTRTPQQLAIAQYWGNVNGTAGPAGIWSGFALTLAARSHFDERATARTLAMMHMAGMDASIGCWDAKFTYWLIRPFQADPAITTPTGRPNFPSYPSAHSCLSSAYGTVLAGLFPQSARELNLRVDEAGMARIYAGLHYRFDVTAGKDLGTRIGALALGHAPVGEIKLD